MTSIEDLQRMIRNFSPSELRELLGFAGNIGSTEELQMRALDLLSFWSHPVQMKILELNRRRLRALKRQHRPYRSSSVPSALNFADATYGFYRSDALADYCCSDYASGIACSSPQESPAALVNERGEYTACTDVRLKESPLCDVLAVLLRPTSLIPSSNSVYQESHFQFHLSPQHVQDIAVSRNLCSSTYAPEHNVQVRLRFCVKDTAYEQDDRFPPNVRVKVNGLALEIPRSDPKKPTGLDGCDPIDITQYCRLSDNAPNNLIIAWTPDIKMTTFVVAVFLVRRLDASVLLWRLRSKGVSDPERTRALVREKLRNPDLCRSKISRPLDPDLSSEISVSAKASLICPVGKIKIQIPIRTISCSHLQCFDAAVFLRKNEGNSRWSCPLCGKPAPFGSLVIDGLFTEMLAKAPAACTKVQLREDGSWAPIMQQSEFVYDDYRGREREVRMSKLKRRKTTEIVDLVRADNDEIRNKQKQRQPPPVVDLAGGVTSEELHVDVKPKEIMPLHGFKTVLNIKTENSPEKAKRSAVKLVDVVNGDEVLSCTATGAADALAGVAASRSGSVTPVTELLQGNLAIRESENFAVGKETSADVPPDEKQKGYLGAEKRDSGSQSVTVNINQTEIIDLTDSCRTANIHREFVSESGKVTDAELSGKMPDAPVINIDDPITLPKRDVESELTVTDKVREVVKERLRSATPAREVRGTEPAVNSFSAQKRVDGKAEARRASQSPVAEKVRDPRIREDVEDEVLFLGIFSK